jgi:hypothetical protein
LHTCGGYARDNVITGTFVGSVGDGDMNLILETPEPATLSLLGLRLAGLDLIRRRRG